MRILALDIGERRIGVALSDPGRLLAQPHSTLPGGEELAELARRLRELMAELEVNEIVVGLPRRLGGEHGPEAERIETLTAALRELLDPIPVVLWDERLTTVEAERLMIEAGVSRQARRRRIDRVAAAIILQTYLDQRGSGDEAGRRAEPGHDEGDRPGPDEGSAGRAEPGVDACDG